MTQTGDMCSASRASSVKEPDLILELKPSHLSPDPSRTGTHCETWSVCYSPAGSCFAWSMGFGIVKILSWPVKPKDGEDARSEKTVDCKEAVWALAFGPCPSTRADRNRNEHDLLLAVGLNNGLIQVWLVSSGKRMFTLAGHQALVRDLAFAPNGSLTLVSASRDKTLRIWDLAKRGASPHVLRGPNYWVFKCSISPDSSMIASLCNFDSKLYLWSMRSYTFMRHLTYDHERTMVSCDFSPDGALLAVASYSSSTGWWLDLWDPYTADLLARVENCELCSNRSDTLPTYLSFSPVGLLLAFKDYRALQIWDVEQDELVMETDHNRAGGLCCAFHPHGGVIATGCRNGLVKFWSVPRRVPSLRHLCRASLRFSVSTYQVEALPLPLKIQEFLTYRDVPKQKILCYKKHHS